MAGWSPRKFPPHPVAACPALPSTARPTPRWFEGVCVLPSSWPPARVNVGWDEQFLAPLPLIPRIPRIPGMSSKSEEKRVIYNTKLTLAIQEFTKIKLSRMPAPRWCPKGPRWSREVPWGTSGFPWAPLWTLLLSLGLPLGSLWLALGPLGSHIKPSGAPQEASRHPTI